MGNRSKIFSKTAWINQSCAARSIANPLSDGPAPPPGHAPGAVFEVLPRIRPLLLNPEQREAMIRAAEEQLAKEADEEP